MKKEIFGGAGMGILAGFIIGLSSSEVTGIILGALVSLLAAFFGLREKKGDDKVNHVLIGAFGFFCVAGIIMGVITRTHHWLAPSMENKYKEYANLSYLEPTDVKRIFFLKEFGLDIQVDSSTYKLNPIVVKPINPGDDAHLHSLSISTEFKGKTISFNNESLESVIEKMKNLNKQENDPYEEMLTYIETAVPDADTRKKLLVDLYNMFVTTDDKK